MTKADARKILGVSSSAGLRSAERAYHQKCQVLQFRMLPGNPCADRQRAQTELVEVTDALKTMQTKRPTKNRWSKPKRSTSKPKPAKRTTASKPQLTMADYLDILIGMVPLPKAVVIAILIAEFVLVMITLVLHSMKGA